MTRVSPYLLVVLIFIWFLDFGWFCQQLFYVSEECGSPRSCLSPRSLDTVEDVTGGEVDELEEDVG